MSYKRQSPTPVVEGGTGKVSYTANAPLVAGTSSTAALAQVTTGLNTAGYVLTANSSGAPTFQAAGGGGGINTIDGDSGSVTGSTVTVTGGTSGAVFTGSGTTLTESFNYLALPSTTSSNGQITINTTPFMHAYGSNNTFLGSNSGNFTTATQETVGIGWQCMQGSSGGNFNTGIGAQCLQNAGSGSGGYNTFVGGLSGYNLDSGANNLGLGCQAGSNYVGAESSNIVLNNLGVASESNTMRLGAGTGTGTQQINATYISGINGITNSLPTTSRVVFVDTNDQLAINNPFYMFSAGTGNNFIGASAGNASVSGSYNIGLGDFSLNAISSGQFNMAIGAGALRNSTGDSGNVAIGVGALNLINGGGSNSAIGQNSLESLATGSSNIAIGNSSGVNYTAAESSNICLNHGGVASESNALHIGSGTGTGSGQINSAYISGINGIGITGVPVLVSSSDQLGIAVSSERFKDNISDMDDFSANIMNLRPVTFTYKGDSTVNPGFIAEEVNDVMPSMVVFDKDGLPLTVKYNEFPAMLLNEIQKMAKRIEDLEAQLPIK